MKKVYLSETNKKVWGVLGGVGEAFDIDPTLIRLLFVFLMFATAVVPAVFTYILAWLIIPKVPVARVVD
jgi:phage shock protein C